MFCTRIGIDLKKHFISLKKEVFRKTIHICTAFVPLFIHFYKIPAIICTSLISGIMAKESVVSTLQVLFSGNIASVLTPLAASSLLVFSLLYSPCVAAIASVKRELGGKWAIGVALWQCVIAWVVAFIVHLIGSAVGMV